MAHTPGPAHHSYREWDDNDTVCSDEGVCIAVRPQLLAKSMWDDTAMLLAAAYTSYDRHCGANAVQMAEEDLLGQALESLEHLSRTACRPEDDDKYDDSYDDAQRKARDVLAKVKGT